MVKAIRGLGESVYGIVFGSVESGDVFIAAGHSVSIIDFACIH